jgi:hypothetical protein
MAFQTGSAGTFPRRRTGETLRVLLCIAITPNWYDADRATRDAVLVACNEGFRDLRGRFGFNVIGTFDDDEIMVGPSHAWPWTAYILAEAPNFETVVSVCNIVRDTQVGEHQLWRYMRIEARLGSEMYFATE